MSIQPVTQLAEDATRARWRMNAPPSPVDSPIVPVLFSAGPGNPPRQLVFPAQIYGQAQPMFGKYCDGLAAEDWFYAINFYQWRAVWTGESYDCPTWQPRVALYDVPQDDPNFACYEVLPWPANADTGGSIFAGNLAINTAELDYYEPYCRGSLVTCAGNVFSLNPPDEFVTMSVGLWRGSVIQNERWAAAFPTYQIPRHDRIVPYFHRYVPPLGQPC